MALTLDINSNLAHCFSAGKLPLHLGHSGVALLIECNNTGLILSIPVVFFKETTGQGCRVVVYTTGAAFSYSFVWEKAGIHL